MNLENTIKFVREQRTGVKTASIAKLFDYWRGTQTSASSFKKYGPKKTLADMVKSARKVKFALVRVGVQFTFENPETEEMQVVGFDIDADAGLSKQDLLKHISNKIFEWLFHFYQFKDLSQFKTADFLNQIKILSIEGI